MTLVIHSAVILVILFNAHFIVNTNLHKIINIPSLNYPLLNVLLKYLASNKHYVVSHTGYHFLALRKGHEREYSPSHRL